MSFWDRRAASFDLEVSPGDKAVAAARAHLGPGDAVLEIGCAVGATARALRPAVASWHGVDVSPEMVRIAQRQGGDITYQAGTVADAPAGPYDAVVAFNVLHFMDLGPDIGRIADRLRPGGVLLAQTPCLGDMRWPMRLVTRSGAWIIRLRGLRILRFDALLSALRRRFDIAVAHGTPATQTWIVARRR